MPKTEPAEPKLSAALFDQRCKRLAVRFAQVLGRATGEIAFVSEISSTEAVMTLSGRASETIARNRGKAHSVVPLCTVTDDVLAWTGYREAWKKERLEQSFRFVEGGFTLHVGREGEITKPQILRSEWVGRRGVSFANLAGHPHWQFDAIESARARSPEPPARFQDPTVDPFV